MSCQRKICLVVLVGIPASGKTFFGNFLKRHLVTNSNSVLGSVQFYSVCYDSYAEVRWPQLVVSGDCWKNKRLAVLKDVEQAVRNIRDNDLDKGCLNNVEIFTTVAETSDMRPVLILIDDNMYFRSMRYEYFKLARTHNLGFCQIYFDVTPECAMQKNKMRSYDEQVPEHIIQNMFVKFEPPAACNSWEKNTVKLRPYLRYEDSEVLHELLAFIKAALDNPIQNVPFFCTKQSEESREINNCNTIHKVDNILKRLISPLIKSEIEQNKFSNSKSISQFYCNKRLEILKNIKNGSIELGFDLTQQDSTENFILIESFLLSLLKN